MSLLDIHLNIFCLQSLRKFSTFHPDAKPFTHVTLFFWELNFVNFDFSALFFCLLRCAPNLLIFIWSICKSLTWVPCAMYSNKQYSVTFCCVSAFVTGWFMHKRLFPDTATDQSNGNVCTLLILHFKSNFEIRTLSIYQNLREIHVQNDNLVFLCCAKCNSKH